jgi:hypothetical protein
VATVSAATTCAVRTSAANINQSPLTRSAQVMM